MSTDATILRVMPREMRLMSERILSLTELPKGFALMALDLVMYSEAMGLGGFALLETRIDALKPADPRRLTLVSDTGPRWRLDANGEHAWFVIPSAIDLLDEAIGDGETAEIEIVGAADPEELAVATAFACRSGLTVTCAGTVLTARRAESLADPVMDKVLQDGCRIAADQWWRIYELAQTALAPDTVVSRRHAGPVIVTEDGTVIGRSDNDDDTDVSFIGSSPTKAATAQHEKAC